MDIKIGRFDAYVPDSNFIDVILFLLSQSGLKKGSEFVFDDLHKFFFEIKKQYPELLKDVHFYYDDQFPFSKTLAECLSRIQEYGYITRPNPSLNRYRLDSDLTENIDDIPSQLRGDVKEVATKLKSSLHIYS
jgi:hypothetical protein